MNTSAHIVVSGMVQGVGFRYFVQHHARLLNLAGWVRNLPNGDVEIEVEGDQTSVENLIVYVRRGSRSAVVSNVDIKWQEPGGRFADFEINHW